MWWLRAAQDGDGNAANALGALHAERGETQTAERWYRAAMDAGDINGAYNLGLLCADQGRTAQAEQWYRRAAYAGHREAANALAILLLRAGDETGAEPWFSKAAETGSVDAAFNLGILHAGRGEERSALRWYERAAAAGHMEAALQVGMARLREGEESEAERFLRCAAGAAARRPPTGWQRCWTRAGRRSPRMSWGAREPAQRVRGMVRAGRLAGASAGAGAGRDARGCAGDVVEAARWYREAAESGSRNGAFNLGLLLAREGVSRRRRCGGRGRPTRGTGGRRCGWPWCTRAGGAGGGAAVGRAGGGIGAGRCGGAGDAAAGRVAGGAVRVSWAGCRAARRRRGDSPLSAALSMSGGPYEPEVTPPPTRAALGAPRRPFKAPGGGTIARGDEGGLPAVTGFASVGRVDVVFHSSPRGGAAR
ncbi:hypothetical protein SHKM778_15390 [Streptomyces sp. KM77-8]|uniref:Sel1 repeat family protein n=1 Tax=Streptomyces haneummycinicus TaxID=3074435 RepID=A0AAT9HCM3_9ACTN